MGFSSIVALAIPNNIIKKRLRCRKKFLRFFKKGFADEKYYNWERGYKWEAHLKWKEELSREKMEALLDEDGGALELARRAVKIESRTNLLFSFEKMALRDGVKTEAGARHFAEGIYTFLHGEGDLPERFGKYKDRLAKLPRVQTRVLAWPVLTVFGFLGNPREHFFLKPNVTRIAAEEFGYDFEYASKPNWDTYFSLLGFAAAVKKDLKDLKPRDMIDLQSYIWVLGSSEYD
jgi:hypothetical protein